MANNWPAHTMFTYHEVLPGGRLSRYSVSTTRFQAHLKLFQVLGEHSSCTPRISFDDGHSSNVLHAAPLLQRFDRTATFFVTVGFIAQQENFMGWPEVRSLMAAGHAVEAHGWSHRFLTECSDAELAHELVDARACLEDRIGRPVTELSLPGGRYDERVLMSAAEAGYLKVYCSEPWSQRVVAGSLRLEGRAMVRRDMSALRLSGLARQTTVARSLVYAEHGARNGLRKLLGASNYHALWARASGRQEHPGANNEESLSSTG